MNKIRLVSSSVFITVLLLVVLGCANEKRRGYHARPPKAASPAVGQTNDTPESVALVGRPRVHTIGTKNVLVFRKGESLLIPVEGRELASPALHITCDLQGVGRLKEGVDFKLIYTTPDGETFIDLFYIELSESYLRQAKTGDPLLVGVYVRDRAGIYPVASGTRSFVFYEADDYRNQFLESHLKAHELTAFPLPQVEAKRLFGYRVADYYFAVRIAFRNSSAKDRIINTGMIRAYGRALVTPLEGTEPLFTIPVTVSPQSREHIYAIITDTKPYITREWIFRSLEFGGALATSIAIGFDGSEDLIKGLGIFTGVLDPGARKLWPDPVPDYLKNIVNFAAPELIKVPAQGESRPLYLFFSKEKIQAMVSDASLFQQISHDMRTESYAEDETSTRVVYLAFDNLEIPFGNLINPTEGRIAVAIAKAREKITGLAQEVRQVQDSWLATPPGKLYELAPETFVAVSNSLRLANSNLLALQIFPDVATNQVRYGTKLLAWWTNLLTTLPPAAMTSPLEPYRPARLSLLNRELDSTTTALLAGSDSSLHESRVNDIDKQMNHGIALLSFYQSAAQAAAAPDVTDALEAISHTSVESSTNLLTWFEPLQLFAARLIELKKGAPGIKPVTDLPAAPVPTATPTPAQPPPPDAPVPVVVTNSVPVLVPTPAPVPAPPASGGNSTNR